VIGYVWLQASLSRLLEWGDLVSRYIEQTVGQPAIRDYAHRILGAPSY